MKQINGDGLAKMEGLIDSRLGRLSIEYPPLQA